MTCVFNRTEFANIADTIEYMQARMFKGKDGQPLHLRRVDDTQIHEPRARAFTQNASPTKRRPSANDRLRLAQQAMGPAAAGAKSSTLPKGTRMSSTLPRGAGMMAPTASGGGGSRGGGGDVRTMPPRRKAGGAASMGAMLRQELTAGASSDPKADQIITIVRRR